MSDQWSGGDKEPGPIVFGLLILIIIAALVALAMSGGE